MQVRGGAGIAGDLYIGGNVYPQGIFGTISTATNIAGGTAGALVYQLSTGSTTFRAIGSTGTVLQSDGAAPQWVTTGSLHVKTADFAASTTSSGFATTATLANTATNIAGGTAGQVPYQIAPSQTGFTGPGSTGTVFVGNGTNSPTFSQYPQISGWLAVGTTALTTATIGEIRATNEITAYYTSDARLKENVRVIESPSSLISQIRGVYFDWIDEHIEERGGEDGYFVRKQDIGVIAQEVENVLPEIVATRDNGYKAVKYEKIVPLLIEAVKELYREVEELKKKNQ